MHTIRLRSARESELAKVTRVEWESYGCLFVLGIGPIYLLGRLGAALTSDPLVGRIMGTLTGVLLLVTVLLAFRRFDRRNQHRRSRDRKAGKVQEITVTGATVVEIGLINDREPVLAFGIGDGKVLFLQGQWLRGPSTYGAPPAVGDPAEEFLNGLGAPFAFPSDRFTLTRLPESGESSRSKFKVTTSLPVPRWRRSRADTTSATRRSFPARSIRLRRCWLPNMRREDLNSDGFLPQAWANRNARLSET